MTLDKTIALAIFCFVSSITPGPNNMMLLASSLNHGLRRTMPMFIGIQLGFSVMFLLLATGIGAAFASNALAMNVLKWVGCGWLLWLAYKIATASVPDDPTGEKTPPMGFFPVMAFQWVNPKAWVFSLSTIGAFAEPSNYLFSCLVMIAVILVVGIPCSMVWSVAGLGLRQFLSDSTRLRMFNYLMAGLLTLSLIPMLR